MRAVTGAAVIGVTVGVIANGTELGSLFQPKKFMKFESQNQDTSYDYTKDQQSRKKSNLADNDRQHKKEADRNQQEVTEAENARSEKLTPDTDTDNLKLADNSADEKNTVDGVGVNVNNDGKQSDISIDRPGASNHSDGTGDTGADSSVPGREEGEEGEDDPGNTDISENTPDHSSDTKPDQKQDDSDNNRQPGSEDKDQNDAVLSWEDRQLEPKDPIITSLGKLTGIQAEITRSYYACGDSFEEKDAVVTAVYENSSGKTVYKTLSYGGDDGYSVSFSTQNTGTQVAVFSYYGMSVRCQYKVLDNSVTIGYGAIYADEYYQCDFPGTPMKSISQSTFDALTRFSKSYNRQPVSGNVIDLKEMHRKMIALLGDTQVKAQFSNVYDGSYHYTRFLEEADGYLTTMVEGFRGMENKKLKESRSYIYYPAEGWQDLRSRNIIDIVAEVPEGYKIRRVTESDADFENYTGDQVLEAYQGDAKVLDIPMGVTKVSLKQNIPGVTTVKIPQSVLSCDTAVLGEYLPDLQNYAYADDDSENTQNQYYKIIDGMLCSADGKTLLSVPAGRSSVTIPKSITNLADGCLKGLSEDAVIHFESQTPPKIIGETEYCGHILLAASDGDLVCKKFMFAFGKECSNIFFDVKYIAENPYIYVSNTQGEWLTVSGEPGTLAAIPEKQSGCYTTEDDITAIGTDAFTGCRKLTDIVFAKQVTHLQKGSLCLPENIRSISVDSSELQIDPMVFGDPADGNQVPDIQIFVRQADYSHYLSDWSEVLDPVYGTGTARRLLQIRENVTYLYEDGIKYEEIQTNGKLEYRLLKVYEPDRTAIRVKEGTTEIYADAFDDCTGLEILYLPETVNNINDDAWDTCSALETIICENPDFEFISPAKCGIAEDTQLYMRGQDYENFLWDQGIVYGVRKDGSKTLLNVPTDYAQDVVVQAGTVKLQERAFAGCTQMKDFSLEENEKLTQIGAACFEGCTGLANINLEKMTSLTQIGAYAFKNCTGLQSLILPKDFKTIPVEFCSGCVNLSSIRADGVTAVLSRAFANCDSLTDIYGMDELASLGDEVFSCCRSLRAVVLPKTLSQMGEECFENCISLEKITLNGRLSGISRYCFYGCRSLSEISFSEKQRNTLTVIGVQAFGMCQKLQQADLTNMKKLTRMGSETFIGCEELTKVLLPENLVQIPDACFESCRNLSIVEINSEKLPELGANVFGTTLPAFLHLWVSSEQLQASQETYASLLDQNYGAGTAENILGVIDEKVEIVKGVMSEVTDEGRILKKASSDVSGDYTIPEDTIAIADGAFKNCTQLTGITISENTRLRLGKQAFMGCTGLKNISIEGVVTEWEEETFQDCTGIQTVLIGPMNGEEIAQIGARAFKNCTGLQARGAVEIRAKIKTIGEECFAGCENLDSISLADQTRASLITIGDSAFDGCKKLTAFLTSKFSNLTTIGAYAFRNCDTLKQPSIPAAVVSIGEGCFMDCDNILYVSFYGPLKEYPKDCFRNCTKLIRTGGTAAAFHALEKIGDHAYAGCASLTSSTSWSLERYDSLAEIGDSAFEGCAALADSTLSETVSRIGANAFSDCQALHTLHLKAVVAPEIGTIDLERMPEDFRILVPDSKEADDEIYRFYLEKFREQENGTELGMCLDSETDGAKERWQQEENEE